jgi:hypothetical protein
LDHIEKNIGKNKLANIFKEQFHQVRDSGNNSEIIKASGGSNCNEMGLHVGLAINGNPNIPRPPDLLNAPTGNTSTTPLIITPSQTQNEDVTVEGEIFEDANDQGSNMGSDSEMEIVRETLELSQ